MSLLRSVSFSGLLAMFVAGVTAVASGGGCGGDKPAAPPPTPEVLVTTLQSEDLPVYIEMLGSLDGWENIEIRARVPGYLLSQDYLDGTFVKKGQLLFTIDPSLTRATTAQAAGQVSLAEAALAKARSDLARTRPLAAAGVMSQQDLEHAVAAEESAAAQLAAAQGGLNFARANLGYTRVLAPVDGLAGFAKVRAGALVGQGEATLLTTVSQIDPIRVSFAISEQEYLANPDRVRELGSVELILANGTVYAHRGKVELIDRQVDPTTGTLTLQALFPNPDRILRPGLYGKVRGVREIKKGAILVPQRAVTELQGTFQLDVVGSDNKVEIRPVTIGERVGSRWVIEKGLRPGERVIVEGLQKVRAGQVVTTKPYVAPPPPQGAPPPGASTGAGAPSPAGSPAGGPSSGGGVGAGSSAGAGK